MLADKRRQLGPRSCQVSWDDDDASAAPANSPAFFVFPHSGVRQVVVVAAGMVAWGAVGGGGGGQGGGGAQRSSLPLISPLRAYS